MEFVIFVVLFFGALLAWAVLGGMWQRRVWRAVADKTGLDLIDGGGFSSSLGLTGTLQGIPIEAKNETRGIGRNRTTFTVFTAELGDDLPPGIEIFHEGLVSKVGKFLGGRDIEVGIADIDRRFIIRGSSAMAARNFLENPTVRKALVSLHDHCDSMHLKQRRLSLEFLGIGLSQGDLMANLTRLAETAREIRDGYTYVDPHVSASTQQVAPFEPEPKDYEQEQTLPSNTMW